ncbi:MAG: response regulator [Nitrospirota bacterium]
MIKSKLGRLLIVDDEVELVTPLCGLLSEWGYEAVGYTSSKDALETLKEHDFDLLLSDLVMPEIDGIELMKAAMKIDPHLVCIIISGKGTIQTAVEAMKVGAFDYIVKPLDWKLLKLILSRAMEVRRLREATRDITDRKRMEEKLKTALNEWRITLDSTTDQIMLLNSEMEIIKANLATTKFLSMPFNKILGKKCYKLFHGKNMPPAECPFEKMKRTKEHVEAELYLSERGIWIRISVDPIFDDKGNLTGSVHISKDISAYKKAGEALKWRLEFEKTIANISSRFVEDSNVDKSINAALRDMGILNGASRAYLFIFSEDGTSVDNTHEWCAEGVTPQIDNLQNLPTEMFPWWMQKLRNREVIHITDVSKMPEEAKAEKEILESQDIKSLLVIPLISADKLAGFIGFDNVEETGEWSEEDLALLRISSGLIGNVLERKRAEDELKSSREQLRNLSAHLQTVREEEGKHIAREIHDELGQALTALKMDASLLINKLPNDQKQLIEKTKSMSKLIDATIQTVQRILTELRPGLLDDLGLLAAIEWQAEEFQKRTGIKCEVTLEPDEIIIDQDRSTAIFRIFQEALTNVSRHANATTVKVNLKKKAEKLILKVKDDGRGITEKQISDPKSLGLIGIRERVHLFGGEFKISGIRDKGTAVTVGIPLVGETDDKNTRR